MSRCPYNACECFVEFFHDSSCINLCNNNKIEQIMITGICDESMRKIRRTRRKTLKIYVSLKRHLPPAPIIHQAKQSVPDHERKHAPSHLSRAQNPHQSLLRYRPECDQEPIQDGQVYSRQNLAGLGVCCQTC